MFRKRLYSAKRFRIDCMFAHALSLVLIFEIGILTLDPSFRAEYGKMFGITVIIFAFIYLIIDYKHGN